MMYLVILQSSCLNKIIFSHILLCNLLTTILKPNFEEPLDTINQLIEKNISISFWPGAEGNKIWLTNSLVPEYSIMGENAIVAKNYEEYENTTANDILGAGTHAKMSFFLDQWELEYGEKYHPEGKGWYRSKEKTLEASRLPYFGYVTNKKWHLNKVESKIICP